MCLIVVKPKGKSLPDDKQISQWFKSHPDGFGLAYPSGNGKVRILKGAMTEPEAKRLVRRVKKILGKRGVKAVDIMLHFRQSTGGAVIPANCHPFPLTKDQEALGAVDIETECAVAHNGVIFDYASYNVYGDQTWTFRNTQKTDTQEFIEDYLVDLGESLWLPAVQKLIEAYTSSKFALMTPEGVVGIGEFLEDKGYYYSNGGFKDVKPMPVASVPQTSSLFLEPSRKQECAACYMETDNLYALPEDDSPLCRECFKFYEGREPLEEEGYDCFHWGKEQYYPC